MLVTPNIPRILKIFDPIILPIEISVSFRKAAVTEVASSGMLVPIAIIDKDITLSDIPIFLARDEAPSTSEFAPKTRPNDDTIINITENRIVCSGFSKVLLVLLFFDRWKLWKNMFIFAALY